MSERQKNRLKRMQDVFISQYTSGDPPPQVSKSQYGPPNLAPTYKLDESPYQAALAARNRKFRENDENGDLARGRGPRVYVDPQSPGAACAAAEEERQATKHKQKRAAALLMSNNHAVSPSSPGPALSASVPSFEVIRHPDGSKEYLVFDFLGKGTCGRVLRCWEVKLPERTPTRVVAIKVIRDKPAYFEQAIKEVKILKILNKVADPDNSKPIVRMFDSFVHKNHCCLVFEAMSAQLYEILRLRRFKGFPAVQVRWLACQITEGLALSHAHAIIHCDLKPENVLILNSSQAKKLVHVSDYPKTNPLQPKQQEQHSEPTESPVEDSFDCHAASLRVIDYGSARLADQLSSSYIQSRFYRSPEVLLGISYNCAIDVWSLGCVIAELYLGLPLFPGASEFGQMARISALLGLPPVWMIENGKFSEKFFVRKSDRDPQDEAPAASRSPLPSPVSPQTDRFLSQKTDWRHGSTSSTAASSESASPFSPRFHGTADRLSPEDAMFALDSSNALRNWGGARHVRLGRDSELTIITESVQFQRALVASLPPTHIAEERQRSASKYRMLTLAEKSRMTGKPETHGKECLCINSLDDLLLARPAEDHPMPSVTPASRFDHDTGINSIPVNELLVDCLKKMLTIDPRLRMTAEEALKHPFIAPVRELALAKLGRDLSAATAAQKQTAEVIAAWYDKSVQGGKRSIGPRVGGATECQPLLRKEGDSQVLQKSTESSREVATASISRHLSTVGGSGGELSSSSYRHEQSSHAFRAAAVESPQVKPGRRQHQQQQQVVTTGLPRRQEQTESPPAPAGAAEVVGSEVIDMVINSEDGSAEGFAANGSSDLDTKRTESGRLQSIKRGVKSGATKVIWSFSSMGSKTAEESPDERSPARRADTTASGTRFKQPASKGSSDGLSGTDREYDRRGGESGGTASRYSSRFRLKKRRDKLQTTPSKSRASKGGHGSDSPGHTKMNSPGGSRWSNSDDAQSQNSDSEAQWSTKALVSLAQANRLASPVGMTRQSSQDEFFGGSDAGSPITSPGYSPRSSSAYQMHADRMGGGNSSTTFTRSPLPRAREPSPNWGGGT